MKGGFLMIKVLLISGKAESGKDTIANMVMKKCVYETCYNLHIAGNVKRIARESFGWDGIKDARGRALLQLIGDGGRQYDPDIWINEFLLDLDEVAKVNKDREALIVVPDVRYKNEVRKIAKWGQDNDATILSIRVDRPNHKSRLTDEQLANSSETDLDDWGIWDIHFINDGNLDDLEVSVLNSLEVLRLDYKP